MKKNSNKAFSLIELSIVIIIIGILIAGVTTAQNLVGKSKLSSAQSLTKSSPVNSIDDLYFWVEATLPESYTSTMVDDTEVTNWRENSNIHVSDKLVVSSSTAAKYPQYQSECMNDLPCVNFISSQQDNININKGVRRFVDELSLFIVFKPESYNGTTQALIQVYDPYGWNRYGWRLRLESTNKIAYSYRRINDEYPASSADNTLINNTTQLASVVDKGAGGITLYHNGSSVATNAGIAGYKYVDQINMASFKSNPSEGFRSNYFNGSIGEIIIFTRGLKEDERKDIEEYLMRKWSIK